MDGTSLSPRERLASVAYARQTRGLLVDNSGNIILNDDVNVISNGTFSATIGGGTYNVIDANSEFSTIGGGRLNDIGHDSYSCTIGGGYENDIGDDSDECTIAGGESNEIGHDSRWCTIGGGRKNDIGTNSLHATIPGGMNNEIGNGTEGATIGGGAGHVIGADSRFSTISGGYYNSISNDSFSATISGGAFNKFGANSSLSTIGGGYENYIDDDSLLATVAGGFLNYVGTNSPSATIPGGSFNEVGHNAAYAFAAGRRAHANHRGTLIWADSTDADFTSTSSNQFLIRAGGGVGIGTNNPSALLEVIGGATCDGTTWNDVSDKTAKENFEAVDAAGVLEKVARLPITTWNYRERPEHERHIGPMAQDFHELFGVGINDTTLSGVDRSGVALAAIQGLHAEVKAKDEKIADLAARLERMEAMMAQVVKNETVNAR